MNLLERMNDVQRPVYLHLRERARQAREEGDAHTLDVCVANMRFLEKLARGEKE